MRVVSIGRRPKIVHSNWEKQLSTDLCLYRNDGVVATYSP